MLLKRVVLVSVVLGGLIGCCCEEGNVMIDRTAMAEEIRTADIDLGRAVTERDIEGFRTLIAEETAFYGSSGVLRTRDDVTDAWGVFFDPESGTTLNWQPLTAEVAASGDLGFTTGAYTMVSPSPEGEDSVTRVGDYVTIWKKNADGNWQAVLDIGNPREG